MFRFASLALVGAVALGSTLATPAVSRAGVDLNINLGRAHFDIGVGPRVVFAPAPVVYPVQPAPVVVDYGYRPILTRPVVVPEYYPYPVGYRGYVIPHYEHHHHYHHDHR